MAKSIQDNGTLKVKQKKAMVFKYGLMDPNMKDFGIMIWLEALDVLF
jgi:hypothetical protein